MEFTYTEAKELINQIGRFEVTEYNHYGLTMLESDDGAEYAIGTDDEAEYAWEESLDSYIDECILPEIPKFARFYFNEEKWKRDARIDGRGHSLSSYDGRETDIGDLVMFKIN